MGRPRTPEQRAGRLQARQHGAISWAQALEVGLTRDQIAWRVKTGRWWHPVHRVYVSASTECNSDQGVMVACLAGPAGTVASHLSAAALFGLGKPPSEVHVTVPPSCSGRVVGCIRHRSAVDRVDRCVVAGIPCTRPARTLVDCAAVVGYEALCDLVDDALCRRLTKVSAVYAAGARVGRGPGRKGVSQIHRALQVWAPGPEPGSPAEMRMIRRVQQLGFPLPERQVVVRDAGGRFVARLDAGWEDRRFGLEYLGERHHGPREWVDDDTRDDRIAACGWRVESVDRFDLRPGSTRLSEILGAVFRA